MKHEAGNRLTPFSFWVNTYLVTAYRETGTAIPFSYSGKCECE